MAGCTFLAWEDPLPTRLPGAPRPSYPTRGPDPFTSSSHGFGCCSTGAPVRFAASCQPVDTCPTSSRIKPAYLIAGGVVVVAAVVLGFVLLGGADTLPIIGGSPRPPTPEFAFEMKKVTPVATSAESKHADLETEANAAADQVREQMDALYIGAFLDTDNWLDDSYDSVWELFDEGAGVEAQSQVDTLTAGSGAGEAFGQILPETGVLKTKVLFNPKGEPYSVVAITRFEAVGTRQGRSGHSDDQPRRVRLPAGGRGMAGRVLQGAPRQRGAGAQPDIGRDADGEPVVNIRRRATVAILALVAWVAGSALGTLGSITPASAQAGLVIGKAHAGYAPSLTG